MDIEIVECSENSLLSSLISEIEHFEPQLADPNDINSDLIFKDAANTVRLRISQELFQLIFDNIQFQQEQDSILNQAA
jgi:hypothetical protein